MQDSLQEEHDISSTVKAPPKGKGKGPGKSPGKASLLGAIKAASKPKSKPAETHHPPSSPQKWHTFQVFWTYARLQLEDGHWGKDTQAELARHFLDPAERDAFLASSEYYVTITMLVCGQMCLQGLLGAGTKLEKCVKLGDGRGVEDKAETKVSDLSPEETQERISNGLNAAQARLDWREAAEAWLDAQPLEEAGDGGRYGAELRAKADLAKHFLVDDFQKKAPGRQNLSPEEKKKREQMRLEKEAIMRKKEEEQRAAALARSAHYASLPSADIMDVPWESAVEVNVCAGGSGGAALIDLGSSCVVLKAQRKTATNEMIAQHLANDLKVPVAQVRVVKYGEAEYATIKNSAKPCRIVGHQRDLAFTTYFGLQIDQNTGAVEDRGHEVGLFGILEFVSGHPLMGLEGCQVLADPNESLFTSLGKLCSLDVLINNLDRVPLPVWSNEGNMGNVMVAQAGRQVIGIDQQVNIVKAGPGLDRYLQSVKSTVASTLPSGDDKLIIAKLRTCLNENCGAELSDANAKLFIRGLRLGFEAITNAWASGELKQALDNGAAQCADRFSITWDITDRYRPWPRLDDLEEMQQFVCSVATEIAAVIGSPGAGRAP